MAEEEPAEGVQTLAVRIAKALRVGGFDALPIAYSRGQDWETVRSPDPFTRLYLDASALDLISDAVVRKHASRIEQFWNQLVERAETDERERQALSKKYAEGSLDRLRSYAGDVRRAAETLASEPTRREVAQRLAVSYREEALTRWMPFVELALASETVSPQASAHLMAQAASVGLREDEAATLLLDRLSSGGYRAVSPGSSDLSNLQRVHQGWTRAQPQASSALYDQIRDQVREMASEDHLKRVLGGLMAKAKEKTFQGVVSVLFRGGQDLNPENADAILARAAQARMAEQEAALLLVNYLYKQGYLPAHPLPEGASARDMLRVAWLRQPHAPEAPLQHLNALLGDEIQRILGDGELTPEETNAYFEHARRVGVDEERAASFLIEQLGLNEGRFVPATEIVAGHGTAVLRRTRWVTPAVKAREDAAQRAAEARASAFSDLLTSTLSAPTLSPEAVTAFVAAARESGVDEGAATAQLADQMRQAGWVSASGLEIPLASSTDQLRHHEWMPRREQEHRASGLASTLLKPQQEEAKALFGDERTLGFDRMGSTKDEMAAAPFDSMENRPFPLSSEEKSKGEGRKLPKGGLFGGLSIVALLGIGGLWMVVQGPRASSSGAEIPQDDTLATSPETYRLDPVAATPGPRSPSDSETGQGDLRVIGGFVDVRSLPSTTGSAIWGRLLEGARLNVSSWYANCDDGRLWARIVYEGKDGWVLASRLSEAPYASAYDHPDCSRSPDRPEVLPASSPREPSVPSAPPSPTPSPAPAPVDRSRTYRASEVDRPAQPQRTLTARSDKIGRDETVQVDVVVSSAGTVQEIGECQGSLSGCTLAASVARRARFTPAILQNTPVAAHATVRITVAAASAPEAAPVRESARSSPSRSPAPAPAEVKPPLPTPSQACAVDVDAIQRNIQRLESTRCPAEKDPVRQAACFDELARQRRLLASCS